MLKSYVLDASVAVKWFLASEPYAAQARSILQEHMSGNNSFLAPDFFWFEVANVLRSAVRQGRILPAYATRSLSDLGSFARIATVSSGMLREDALEIALQYNCAVYDAAYLALARMTRNPLLTADERLVRATAAHFPIQWIGQTAAVSS